MVKYMGKFHSLIEYYDKVCEDFLEKCTNCGVCLSNCPVTSVLFPEIPPQIIVEKVANFLKDGKESEEVYILGYGCSMCAACSDSCPQSINVKDLMTKVRIEHFKRGKIPEAIREGVKAGGEKSEWTYLMKLLQAMLFTPQEIKRLYPQHRRAENVIFLGCTLTSYFPHYTMSLLDVLENMNIDFTVVAGGPTKDGKMVCCGFPLIQIGDVEMIEKNARGIKLLLDSFSPKTVVFPCAGCYRFFTETYSKFLDLDFEVKYIYQFLLDHMDKVKFKKPLEKTVYLHSSCQGWGGKTNELLYKVFERIPGIKVVKGEMNCCGGTPKVNIPEIYQKLAPRFRNNIASAVVSTAADCVSFQCQICSLAFSPFIVMSEQPFKVESPTSLICEAMGIEKVYEDRWLEYWKCKNDDEIIEASRKYFEANGFSEEEIRKALPFIRSWLALPGYVSE
jgi:Fe-S oxidoreductase